MSILSERLAELEHELATLRTREEALETDRISQGTTIAALELALVDARVRLGEAERENESLRQRLAWWLEHTGEAFPLNAAVDRKRFPRHDAETKAAAPAELCERSGCREPRAYPGARYCGAACSQEAEMAKAAPPTCKGYCGDVSHYDGNLERTVREWCSEACEIAGRPMNPAAAPSKPPRDWAGELAAAVLALNDTQIETEEADEAWESLLALAQSYPAAPLPKPEEPRCEPWCGQEMACRNSPRCWVAGKCWCSFECMNARRPLHPATP